MKSKNVGTISTIVFVIILIAMNFTNIDFGISHGLASPGGRQPENTFVSSEINGESLQENERYGWNITYIENLNGDAHVDLIVGAPWYDHDLAQNTGAVYIFYGSGNPMFDNLNPSSADAKIVGDLDFDKFGWDVADAGDVNDDGINDLIVGAPGALDGTGRAYIFFGGTIPSGTFKASDKVGRKLNGQKADGYYGSSVAGIGDMNNDGYDDVVVGAPGANHVIITYGFINKVTIYPNLWDDDPATKGVVTFDNGVSNTLSDSNTWGLTGADDGWDWVDSFTESDLYGHTAGQLYDDATLYAPWESDGPDADGLTWGNRSSLEVMIGRNHTHYNPYGFDSTGYDPDASAAWGIEFTITNEMYDYISGNSSIKISFNYGAMDANVIYNNTNLSKLSIFTIRSRIWNSTGKYYLGNEIVDSEIYVFYRTDPWSTPPWGPVYDKFTWDITNYIDGPGSYYWDFGCFLDQGWVSRPDDAMMAFFDNVTMKINNEKNIVIYGSSNSAFGTSLAPLGDINNDDYPDFMVGAPGLDCGYVTIVHGKKRFSINEPSSLSNIILPGKKPGDQFGYSLANAGDVDNDGIQDIIIGAPGGNYANLYYGKSLKKPLLIPNLWELAADKKTPQIEFDAGLRTTGNTPGPGGQDDGWDIWNGVYGYQSGNTPGSATKYNGAESPDTNQVAIDDELIIAIGGGYGGGWSSGAKPDSGAYGVEFTITADMISELNKGGEAVLSFDWNFVNLGLDQDDTVWMKASIRSSTEVFDLGWDLDKYTSVSDNKDETNEIHWSEIPSDMQSMFIQSCTDCFSGSGQYYLDLGAKVRNYWWENGAYEDGIFHFDNVYLRINPAPGVKFVGPVNSSFGFSVGSSSKLNLDNYGDIIIGAPNYDSPNGENSGAAFGFVMDPETDNLRLADSAEFIVYGEQADDNFGWSLLGSESLDSDSFTEIIATAINYDSTSENCGKIYMLSITKGPRIRLLHPVGGEIISGVVVINATVTDPDDNIDIDFGVRFSYSTDFNKWTIIGDDKTPPSLDDIYEFTWDTTELPDGTNYFVKGWVRDIKHNSGENISAPVTIDNPHPPLLTVKTPKQGETVAGKVEVSALVKDSELDILGGGINTTKGVQFYFSDDEVNWELLDSAHSGALDVYDVELDTTSHPDGEYWVKVNATDFDGFEVEEAINITIDNPGRPPSITLISEFINQSLSGYVTINVVAYDLDNDINNSGVTIYIAPDTNPEQWNPIGNDPEPEINGTGVPIYSIGWETTKVTDYWYNLKAFVNDSEMLTNETEISTIKVHNDDKNAPYIDLIKPVGGETLFESKMITARVRDLENNLDSFGVNFYYSDDNEQWRYLGTTSKPRFEDKELYDFVWNTATIPDGKYWLKVTVEDETQLTGWDISENPVFIHNSDKNPPTVEILTPTHKQHINGTFTISASAFDLENNINSVGVVFYYSNDYKEWMVISNAQSRSGTDDKIYELSWNTLALDDGLYQIKAEVVDFDDLKGEDISEYFFIHNNQNNAPLVKLLSTHSGEVSGTILLNASVFDLENNINDNGVEFYYSTDQEIWNKIGNDPTGIPLDNEEWYYEITWDTSFVPDGKYYLQVVARDLTDMSGSDMTEDRIVVHNKMTNPPVVTFKQPKEGVPLSRIQQITVDIEDFDDDVESVAFYYSSDNANWILIDTTYKPSKDSMYGIMWDTENIINGKYYIKVRATDQVGNQAEITSGPFEITEGIGKKVEANAEFPYWIIIVIVVIVIMTFIIMLVLRKSKKHEKEIIEEVAAEMRKSMALDDETQELPTADETSASPTMQTYIPPTEPPVPEIPDYDPDMNTIEAYKAQMDAWKVEGYNVSRLENLYSTDDRLFASNFSIFSSNISRLKNIINKLSSMNTAGYESLANSIRIKQYEPDQAMAAEQEFNELKIKMGLSPSSSGMSPLKSVMNNSVPPISVSAPELPQPQIDEILPQLLPNNPIQETSAAEPVQPSDVPLDVELPPDIDLPSPEQQDIPVSPFVEGCNGKPSSSEAIPTSPYSNVQTQSLEEELEPKTKIVKMN